MKPRDHRNLVEKRYVATHAIAQNPNLLDQYPHRHVYLTTEPPSRMDAATVPEQQAIRMGALPSLFWCVETLEHRGWEPVAWDVSGAACGVVMRRRSAPYRHPSPPPEPVDTPG